MKVFIERTNETQELIASCVSELLETLDIVAQEVLVAKNGVLVTEDEALDDDDDIKILSVISGG